jgi:hypothetical protein
MQKIAVSNRFSLMKYAAYLRIVPFAAQNHAANTPSLHGASEGCGLIQP